MNRLKKLVYISIVSIGIFLIYSIVSLNFLLQSQKNAVSTNFSIEQKLLAEEGLELMAQKGCISCHLQNLTSEGPSFKEISEKYSVNDLGYLTGRVKYGGSGVWGKGPKEPSMDLEAVDIDKMVYGILAQKSRNAELKGQNGEIKHGAFWVLPENPMMSFITQLLFLVVIGVVCMAAAAYVLSLMGKRCHPFRAGIIRFFTDKKYTSLSRFALIVMPLLVGVFVYVHQSAGYTPPVFDRAVKVSPPESIQFNGKKIDIAKGGNPLSALKEKEPEKLQEHITGGRRVYYQNCVFCHGLSMEADGQFAHGFNPVPAVFAKPGILDQRTESYLFWRIAKGPELPPKAGPWSTAMPSFENFLSEEEIWDVILYMYDFTGFKPVRNKK